MNGKRFRSYPADERPGVAAEWVGQEVDLTVQAGQHATIEAARCIGGPGRRVAVRVRPVPS